MWDSIYAPDWRRYPRVFDIPANSQIMGQLAVNCGVDGIVYRSVKTGKDCLVAFPQNFSLSGSYLELANGIPETVVNRRYDATTEHSIFIN